MRAGSDPNTKKSPGKLARVFTRGGEDPWTGVVWKKVHSRITDLEGHTVSEMRDVEVPQDWSTLAADVLASKYLRRSGVPGVGHETSLRQVVERVVGALVARGRSLGLWDDAGAAIFGAELTHLLIHQKAAFNSPVWFNLGLREAYGIRSGSGNHAVDPLSGRAFEVEDAYRHPQCSACFIQSVEDDLLAIFELAKTEARLFKFGSGTGTNFSNIRGRQEILSGGGYSSGLMSFLEVLDRGAGATRSGGTTRRAAKMVCLDLDHPEIREFVRWKAREEEKARALIAAGYDSDLNGEAYHTVSGQNSNNSVRVTDAFLDAVLQGREWATRGRVDGREISRMPARELWREITEAAWSCADPGLQFDDTIQAWHTCPGAGRIRASNPCSEFMFLDDTACNLASLNLLRFLREDGSFDEEGWVQAIRILILAQELLVGLSGYPTAKIAENSHRFRPLGLGYANLGALLMVKGLPYDSEAGRNFALAITALLTGEAYRVSAELAGFLGPFEGFASNREAMLGVIAKHESCLPSPSGAGDAGIRKLLESAREAWREARALGEIHGYRNAQVTVLAPTGTIGLLMDCDTTGVEPDFALVKFKKLAGGGVFKMVNQSVPRALRTLGYSDNEISDMVEYLLGTNRIPDEGNGVTRRRLRERGWSDANIAALEERIPGAMGLSALLPREEWREEEWNASEELLCGRMTLEGAPHLREEHLAVFDCANRCGKTGTRFIEPSGHLRMMAAIQPFLSGAISKTVNLPRETTVEEVEDVFWMAWKLGLKAVAIYRDGCKASQPLVAAGGNEEKTAPARAQESARREEGGGRRLISGDALDQQLSQLMADAPKCDACGHITVRSGSCFRCLHCGTSIGCG